MDTVKRCQSCALVAALLLAAGAQAATMSRADYSAAKDRISAEYKQDKAQCKQLRGNAADVCVRQAKGKEDVARAELEYSYSGKPNDAAKIALAKADATYDVARERCNDKTGDGKSTCVAEAKADHTKALADAKEGKKISAARQDANEDKADAEYKLAMQKCENLSGNAKTHCVDAAKVDYKR